MHNIGNMEIGFNILLSIHLQLWLLNPGINKKFKSKSFNWLQPFVCSTLQKQKIHLHKNYITYLTTKIYCKNIMETRAGWNRVMLPE